MNTFFFQQIFGKVGFGVCFFVDVSLESQQRRTKISLRKEENWEKT